MTSSIINKIRTLLNKVKISLSVLYSKIIKPSTKLNYKNNLIKNFKKQNDLDKKLVFYLSKSRIPNLKQIKYIKRYLNPWELRLLQICLFVIFINLAFVSLRFYFNHLQTIATTGGEYNEGLIGTPKYINPLYSNINDVDNDISSLIFSSIFKWGKNGDLINDLASSYEISQDNKNYLIKIKQGIKWHNGKSLTPDDIIFTFKAIKDPQYRSTWRASFSGVDIKKVDDTTIKFILNEPYAAFLELLTFGIIPGELWQQVPANAALLTELNLKPIGSGPYKFKSLVKDKSGNIKSYTLVTNNEYYREIPYLNQITFKFFDDISESISALNNNLINGISYLPPNLKTELVAQDSINFFNLAMPQLTAIFFNTKDTAAVSDKLVRQALALALNKNKIISQASTSPINPIDSPILPDSFAYSPNQKGIYNLASSSQILELAGWKITEIKDENINKANEEALSTDATIKQKAENKLMLGKGTWRSKNDNYLIIELTTANTPEYVTVAEEIAKLWQNIYIKTIINLIPAAQIQSDIIRQRKFQALLYSELVGNDPDPYAFWHSSQIESTGFNITNYANKEVDKLLEDARLTNDINLRKEKYIKFQEILAEEVPAIFLYSSNYTYVQSKEIKGFEIKKILLPRDRFSNITEWYIKTRKKLIW